MIWIIFQLIFATVSGIMVPDTVVIPESTLIPPSEFIQMIELADHEQSLMEIIQPRPTPSYLFIPSIEVRAAIDPVGLTEKGAVDAPKEPGLLGWFDKGPRPGDAGSAIIDGHRGWRNKTPAVFDRLHEVSIGDLVVVMDSDGNTIPFYVYNMQTYDPDESPAEVFAMHDDARLNLITCNGEWDAQARTATKRLVVFTKKLEMEN